MTNLLHGDIWLKALNVIRMLSPKLKISILSSSRQLDHMTTEILGDLLCRHLQAPLFALEPAHPELLGQKLP